MDYFCSNCGKAETPVMVTLRGRTCQVCGGRIIHGDAGSFDGPRTVYRKRPSCLGWFVIVVFGTVALIFGGLYVSIWWEHKDCGPSTTRLIDYRKSDGSIGKLTVSESGCKTR